MYFKQFYLGCLAQASYLIGDGGEAAVVDPRRDVDEYIAEARAQGLTIRWILETHLHADFVSGHRELAERTGGTIVFGEKARAAFPHRAVRDGEEIRLGSLVLRFLATPGHTPESISILVLDPEPRLVLTGDTLFIGDVGRPDLAASPRGLTAADMAAQLYDSLHGKLLALPDSVAVYPAHGAGSLCGRNISSETSSTIGVQRRTNYALHPMPKEDFVRMMTVDLPEAPAYFPRDVEINRAGAPSLPERRAPAALSPAEVETSGRCRSDPRGRAPGGGVRGRASRRRRERRAGRPVRLVVGCAPSAGQTARSRHRGRERRGRSGDAPRARRTRKRRGVPGRRRGRVGRRRASAGTDGADRRRRAEGAPRPKTPGLRILDVRRPGEYAAGHVPGAVSVPLDQLARRTRRADVARAASQIICASGYRSSIAGSLLLQRKGVEPINVVGGTSAWVAAGFPTERPAA